MVVVVGVGLHGVGNWAATHWQHATPTLGEPGSHATSSPCLQVFAQMYALYVFMDFSFYWVHRWLHHPSIYKYVCARRAVVTSGAPGGTEALLCTCTCMCVIAYVCA